jgi:hypothetical protein
LNGIPLSQLQINVFDTRGKIYNVSLDALFQVFTQSQEAANPVTTGNSNFVLNNANAGENLTLNNANLTVPTTVNIGPGVMSGNQFNINVITTG